MGNISRFTSIALSLLPFFNISLAGPIIRLGPNSVVEGTLQQSAPQVEQYLDIPYALPPVGDLRWVPPQPTKNEAYINATKLPPSCMQSIPDSDPGYSVFPPEFSIPGGNSAPMSEDCLKLAIWKPVNSSITQPLPVLIFIHGGAFMGGGLSVPYQIPENWVQRKQNLIVVSVK